MSVGERPYHGELRSDLRPTQTPNFQDLGDSRHRAHLRQARSQLVQVRSQLCEDVERGSPIDYQGRIIVCMDETSEIESLAQSIDPTRTLLELSR